MTHRVVGYELRQLFKRSHTTMEEKVYGEDDFLEAQYEERFISDMDDEPDLYDYSQDYVDDEVEGWE